MAGSSGNWHKVPGAGVKARVYIPVATLRSSGINPESLSARALETLASLYPTPTGVAKSARDTQASPVTVADYRQLQKEINSIMLPLEADAALMRFGGDPRMMSPDYVGAKIAQRMDPARQQMYDDLRSRIDALSEILKDIYQAEMGSKK